MDLEILKIASNTENHKVIKNYTHLSKNKNPICGDVMEISLLVKNDLSKILATSANHVFIVKHL